MQCITIQIAEVEPVVNAKKPLLQIDSLETYVLVGILHLGHAGMRRAVGSNQAITEEVSIAWHIGSKVASISVEWAAVLRVGLQQTLIHPVPNESSLQVGVFIDSLPLVPQVAGRVTHGMSIL